MTMIINKNKTTRTIKRQKGKKSKKPRKKMDSKYSMKEIYKMTRKPIKSNILTLTAENQTLRNMLEEACQELNTIFKYKKKLLKKKGGKIRKNDKDQYTELMREFKHSIKESKPITATKNLDISQATEALFSQTNESSNKNKKIVDVEDEDDWCLIPTISDEEKNTPMLVPELSKDMQTIRVGFLKELSASLGGKSSVTGKKKRRRRVQKMKKQRKFKHIKKNLERFLSERDSSDSSFDEITQSDVDEVQFDFCNDVFPCRRVIPQSFTDSINMIKQKKYKLRKTKRFRKECEFQINKDTAFQRALSEIGFRRQYFVMDEETEEDSEL